jgi:hypothetical protein
MHPRILPTIALALLAILLVAIHCPPTVAVQIDWARQLGSGQSDGYPEVALDHQGGAYLAGATQGILPGGSSGDLYLARYDAIGNLSWLVQTSTSSWHLHPFQLTSDATGNAYVGGSTFDNTMQGFVTKHSPAGAFQWETRFELPDHVNLNDLAADITGHIYATGEVSRYNNPGFVSKIRPDGSLAWSSDFGGDANVVSRHVAADALGNVFLAGYIEERVNGTFSGAIDAFVTKFDSDGTLLWTIKIDSSAGDEATGLAVDGLGNVYVGGSTNGSLPGTGSPAGGAFVAKYNSSGDVSWLKQFSDGSFAHAMAADSKENLYLAGLGPAFNGTWFSNLDATGNLLWQHAIGDEPNDGVTGVSGAAISPTGELFVSGHTSGDLAANNAGFADAYLLKISPIPEPTSAALLAGIAAVLATSTRFRRN